jgi:hypothetical protein
MNAFGCISTYLGNARATLVTNDDYHLRDISDKAAIE